MSVSAVRGLLRPRSIALVGVTENSQWSMNLVANLRTLGFGGRVHMVNPRYQEQFGQRCYASVVDVPGSVDSAYVMTGTATTTRVIEDCGRKGVRSVTLLTAGFAEVGSEGANLEHGLVERCRELGIAMLGPNCLGFVNYHRRTVGYALLMVPPLIPGAIGMVTQSGAVLLQIHRLAQFRAIGLSYLVSSGNEAMYDATDFLDLMLSDPNTRVVGGLLEGIRRPQAFLQMCDRAMKMGKPVVVLKLGRSRAAARSAAAHTGAFTGHDAVADAALRQHGVIRVDTLEDLVETSAVLASSGWPSGRRTAVVTPSGGTCGLISDLAHGTRIELPDFTPAAKRRLKKVLPDFGTPQNPLDTTGFVVLDTQLLGACVEAVTRDRNFDSLVVNSDPPREPGTAPDKIDARLASLRRSLDRAPAFTMVVSSTAGELTDYSRETLLRHRLHVANGLAHGVQALDHAIGYGEAQARFLARRRHRQRPLPLGELSGVLSEVEAKRLLAAAGIATPVEELASSAAAAAAAAERIGFPVVLKVQSPDIPHKTEAGGVRLHLRSPAEVEAAYGEIVEAARRHRRGARIQGVLVARQVDPVVELIAGASWDDQFGPVVLAGMGGIFVEAMADVSLRLPPIDMATAREMLGELRGRALLDGARGRPAGDLEAAAELLCRLGRLAAALGRRLKAIDINPVFVMPRGQGALAGDALVELQ